MAHRHREQNETPNMSRSLRLRKYELMYEYCMKKSQQFDINPKKERVKKDERSSSREKVNKVMKEKVNKVDRVERIEKIIRDQTVSKVRSRDRCNSKEKERVKEKKDVKKKPLNAYQKFVRNESKKDKYKGSSSNERMSAIGKAWKKQKDSL